MFKVFDMYMRPNGLSSKNYSLYRIYKKPEAKELFMKAQTTDSITEKTKLYEKMGEYDIFVDKTTKNTEEMSDWESIKCIFKDALNSLKEWYSIK